jgi:hypothetical protein
VREAEEVERLRFPEAPCPSILGGVPTELDQAGLIRVQFQPERREPLAKLDTEPPSIIC